MADGDVKDLGLKIMDDLNFVMRRAQAGQMEIPQGVSAAVPIKTRPSEIIDRLTILSIKIWKVKTKEQEDKAAAERTRWLEESGATNWFTPEVCDAYMRLYHVNTQLWDVEDDIRLAGKVLDDNQSLGHVGNIMNRSRGIIQSADVDYFNEVCKFVELAKSVYVLNDKRIKIKQEIDLQIFGLAPEQKAYRISQQGEDNARREETSGQAAGN